MATLSGRVKAGRRKARLTQEVLAQRVGMTRQWVAAVETDRIAQPRPAQLRSLAEELGLDYSELLAMTNQLGEVSNPAPTTGSDAQTITESVRAETAAVQALTQAVQRQNELIEKVLSLLTGPSDGSGLARLLVGASAVERRLAGMDVGEEVSPRVEADERAAPAKH